MFEGELDKERILHEVRKFKKRGKYRSRVELESDSMRGGYDVRFFRSTLFLYKSVCICDCQEGKKGYEIGYFSSNRQDELFSLSHEIGHMVLGHHDLNENNIELKEREADFFAKELLGWNGLRYRLHKEFMCVENLLFLPLIPFIHLSNRREIKRLKWEKLNCLLEYLSE